MTSTLRRIGATLLIASLALCAPAATYSTDEPPGSPTRMMRMAPSGTIAYLEARDIDALWKAWNATPVAVMWRDDRFSGFFSPLRERMESMIADAEKGMGASFGELNRTFKGPVAIFMSDRFERKDTAGIPYVDTNIGLIARVSGEQSEVLRIVEAQSRLLTDAPADARRYTEKYQGIDIYHTEYMETYMAATLSPNSANLGIPDARAGRQTPVHVEYAVVEDWLIFLEGQRTFMKKVLELFSAGADGVTPQGSLAADANLRGAAERLGSRSDLFLFLNLERIITEAREDSRKQGRSWAQEQALGLTDVRSLAIGVGLEPRALKLSLALHTKPQARGMMGRLMEPAPPGGFETLRRIPEAVDSCWASRFDLGGVVAAFRDAARADGEAAYDARIQAMSQATGADIDAMLLCLGREIGSYSRPIHRLEAGQAETAAETVFVALASPTGLASDLAKLASLLVSSPVRKVEYKPRDYQGISIYAPEVAGGAASPSPRPDNGLAFAVVGDLLVLATPSDEAEYAVRLATGRGESTIMANDSFRQDFPTGGEGLKALYWGDLRKIVEGALRNLRTKPTFLMALGVFARPTLMPSPEAFGEFFDRVVGRARTDGETLSATFEVIYPGKFERQP